MKTKTKVLKKSKTEKIATALFTLYAIFITGMFLYGFFSVLYALIFDQSLLQEVNFGYAEGRSGE
jgi:uncharacterized membrane protein SpoIIM required for sporulation